MSANSRHLREVLIFCFDKKKSEARRMLLNAYGAMANGEGFVHLDKELL